MNGGNSLQKKRSSSAAARRPKPKARRRPLGDLLRRAPHSTPKPPRAAPLTAGRGAEGRPPAPPAPPPRAGGGAAVAPPQAPPGETRARQVADKLTGPVPGPTPPLPCPQRAHRTGWAGPLDGPEPRSAPRPLRPSLTVSVAPAPGREWDSSVSPAFPEGSARALTSESRRSEAEEGGYPGASSSGS